MIWRQDAWLLHLAYGLGVTARRLGLARLLRLVSPPPRDRRIPPRDPSIAAELNRGQFTLHPPANYTPLSFSLQLRDARTTAACAPGSRINRTRVMSPGDAVVYAADPFLHGAGLFDQVLPDNRILVVFIDEREEIFDPFELEPLDYWIDRLLDQTDWHALTAETA